MAVRLFPLLSWNASAMYIGRNWTGKSMTPAEPKKIWQPVRSRSTQSHVQRRGALNRCEPGETFPPGSTGMENRSDGCLFSYIAEPLSARHSNRRTFYREMIYSWPLIGFHLIQMVPVTLQLTALWSSSLQTRSEKRTQYSGLHRLNLTSSFTPFGFISCNSMTRCM